MTQLNKKDFIVVIGCGRLGSSIANVLSNLENDVIVIDIKKDSFRKLSPSFGGISLIGDATDIDTLNLADVERATIVLIVTNNDNTNIMISQLIREYFDVKHIIARLYDLEKEVIYKDLKIQTICPTQLSALEITRLLSDMEES